MTGPPLSASLPSVASLCSGSGCEENARPHPAGPEGRLPPGRPVWRGFVRAGGGGRDGLGGGRPGGPAMGTAAGADPGRVGGGLSVSGGNQNKGEGCEGSRKLSARLARRAKPRPRKLGRFPSAHSQSPLRRTEKLLFFFLLFFEGGRGEPKGKGMSCAFRRDWAISSQSDK